MTVALAADNAGAITLKGRFHKKLGRLHIEVDDHDVDPRFYHSFESQRFDVDVLQSRSLRLQPTMDGANKWRCRDLGARTIFVMEIQSRDILIDLDSSEYGLSTCEILFFPATGTMRIKQPKARDRKPVAIRSNVGE